MMILASSTCDNSTLRFVQDDVGFYYVNFMHKNVIFEIPNINSILKNGRRAPATSFILFRNILQTCITAMDLRIERHTLSRHACNIWNDLKRINPSLVDLFRTIARDAAQRFYSTSLRIINVNLPIIKYQEKDAHTSPLVGQSIDQDEPALQSLLNDLFPAIDF
ncbi:37107_t:CDS:1 [Racocetra persica]|uniref:37107_t:CDS:1 n=1 Tax=Racocetra persica TaxID=160502 RepID=A0ACA9QRV1_9GLOM|nr:37107_t:CDS:1 [Racocetra persica]